MKKFLLVSLFSVASLMAADGATLFNTCKACHGPTGNQIPPGSKATYTINSLTKEEITQRLKGYKAGTLNQYGLGAQMKIYAGKLSDADITALANYISTLKK